LKVAVVGLGKMGLLHASILSTLPDVELVGICDKSTLIRRFCKEMFAGAKLCGGLEELRPLDLGAVYVTTPIPSHFFITKAVYSNELAKNVFVEKTLASSYDESKQLCEIAKRSGGTNMVGYMKRFGVTYAKARNLLNQEAIGDVTSFEAYAYSSDFYGVKRNPDASTSRGGVIKDLGAHTIDLALWFFGDFQLAKDGVESVGGKNSEDDVQFTVKTLNGSEGRFNVSWSKNGYHMPEFGLIVQGTRGNIKVNDDEVNMQLDNGGRSVWYRHDLDDNVGFLIGSPEYYREDEYFIKAALGARHGSPDFDTASKVDIMIQELQMRVGLDE
jgi:predicted dehydrogenase